MTDDPKNVSCVSCPDRDTAIKNMGGMAWLYEKYDAQFRLNYSDSARRLYILLQSGQTEEARRLIHTVKGLAGTLGYRNLYAATILLEAAIISDQPDINDLLRQYNAELKKI